MLKIAVEISLKMSLAGYLFGNVDEQGRLDADLDDVINSCLNLSVLFHISL